jgi:hypothetical protein
MEIADAKIQVSIGAATGIHVDAKPDIELAGQDSGIF